MNVTRGPRESWVAPIRVGATERKNLQYPRGRVIIKSLPRGSSGARGGRREGTDHVGAIFDSLGAGTCDKCNIFRKPANQIVSEASNGRDLATTYHELMMNDMRRPRQPWVAPIRVGSAG